MVKKLRKQVVPFIQAGIGLSVGGAVISKIGGPVAATAGGGIAAISGFMPVVGIGIGAGAVLRSVKTLKPDTKSKSKGRF